MPIMHTCDVHPDTTYDDLDGALAHVDIEHPGTVEPMAANGGPIRTSFVRMTAALGRPNLRIFLCGTCNVRVETTDDARPPRCDTHLEDG